MTEPVSDPVAAKVALDIEKLQKHGTVAFTGFVMRGTTAGNDGPAEDPNAPTFRLYTSDSFDRWLEIKKNDLLHQEALSDSLPQRSKVWVRGTAAVTQCQDASAKFMAEVMDAGDPGAYPHGRR